MVQEEGQGQPDSDAEEFYLYKFKDTRPSPIQIPLQVEGKPLTMKLDTGAAVSIISEDTKTMFPQLELRKSSIVLRTYTDESMQVTGQLQVHVQYRSQTQPLVLVVVAGHRSGLLGRNWLAQLPSTGLALKQNDYKAVRRSRGPAEEARPAVFRDELGTVQPQKATLHIKLDVAPKVFQTYCTLCDKRRCWSRTRSPREARHHQEGQH